MADDINFIQRRHGCEQIEMHAIFASCHIPVCLIIFTLLLMIIAHWNVSVGWQGHFGHPARKLFLKILMLLYCTVGGTHWTGLN